jgi:hypothetical protein
MTLTESHQLSFCKIRIGAPISCNPDSRTKSPQELICESNLEKTWIGTPIRYSPRLPYQISRIDSGVKFHSYP